MKNKILNFEIIFFIFSISTSNSISEIQFNFDVTNIEILNNGNTFKGSNRGIITADNGIVINGDNFKFEKESNILNVTGNVKIEDTIKNYIIFADNVTYLKNEELIITKQITDTKLSPNEKIIFDYLLTYQGLI